MIFARCTKKSKSKKTYAAAVKWGGRALTPPLHNILQREQLHSRLRWSLLIGIIWLISAPMLPIMAQEPSLPERTITIKIVGAPGLSDQRDWCFNKRDWYFNIRRQLSETSRLFEIWFGIKFKIKGYQNWTAKMTSQPMFEMINLLKGTVSKDGCDVVLGLITDHTIDPKCYGCVSFTSGYILVKDIPLDHVMILTLAHEFCHIFGAVDLNEPNSLMYGNLNSDIKMDTFTAELVRINRGRSFDISCIPLEESERKAVIRSLRDRNALSRNEPKVQSMLVKKQIFQCDWKSALRDCEDGLNRWPQCQDLHHLKGLILFKQGKYEAAHAAYCTALRSGPQLSEIHHNLSLTQLRLGKLAEAEINCQRALELNPHFLHAHITLSSLLIKRDRFVEAEPKILQVLKINSNIAEAHNNLGCVCIHKGHFDSGIKSFKKALDLNPIYNDALYNLGRTHFLCGNKKTAARFLEKVVEQNPDHHIALSLLGACWLEFGDLAAAEKCCWKSLKIKPDYVHGLCNLAAVYFQSGQFAKAWAYNRKALELDPNFHSSHYFLGLLLAHEGRLEAAIKSYHRALRLNPSFYDAAINLGYSYQQLGNYDKSIHFYQQAIALKPDNPEALNNLSVIYFRKGLYRISWKYLERAEKNGFRTHPDFRKTLLARLE